MSYMVQYQCSRGPCCLHFQGEHHTTSLCGVITHNTALILVTMKISSLAWDNPFHLILLLSKLNPNKQIRFTSLNTISDVHPVLQKWEMYHHCRCHHRHYHQLFYKARRVCVSSYRTGSQEVMWGRARMLSNQNTTKLTVETWVSSVSVPQTDEILPWHHQCSCQAMQKNPPMKHPFPLPFSFLSFLWQCLFPFPFLLYWWPTSTNINIVQWNPIRCSHSQCFHILVLGAAA